MAGDDGNGIESKSNWVYYPDSAYDNLKSGFVA
jgi:chitinase